MASYQIASERLSLGKPGETVTDEQLEGCNVEALLAGGHLTPVKAALAAPDNKEGN